jgi:hypothetical protein
MVGPTLSPDFLQTMGTAIRIDFFIYDVLLCLAYIISTLPNEDGPEGSKHVISWSDNECTKHQISCVDGYSTPQNVIDFHDLSATLQDS